jgi:signal peptidase
MLRWCRRLAFGLVAGACLAALVVGLAVPRLAGATPYVVLTGSMAPDLAPGTLVVVRPTEPRDIHVGSVLTYQLESGRPEVVTHRVVAVRVDLRGRTQWQTRGDANGTADAQWVREEQVRGTVWYAVPQLGRVAAWASPGERQALSTALALLLAVYALLMFAGSVTRREPRRHPDAAHL